MLHTTGNAGTRTTTGKEGTGNAGTITAKGTEREAATT